LGLTLACLTRAGFAHPLAPALLELHELGDGRVDVAWKTPLLRPRGPAPLPALPEGCRPLTPTVTATEDTGVRTTWTAQCPALVGERVGAHHLTGEVGALVRVVLVDGRVVQGIVTAAAPLLAVPARPRARSVVRDYVRLGIGHILTGPDHLLFVFGLVLLAGGGRRLLGTVTAFTCGHSVTLSLAALDLIAVPARVVEVAIAATVFALAVELARDAPGGTLLRRRPAAMAAIFGLLHGLGFAAALREAGLPPGDIPLALAAFNGGIEVGQLLFVAVVLAGQRALGGVLAGFRWRRRVPVYAMGSLAALWWIERAASLLP
jgi:hydrogenase/urease accessory protein HupE